jgi:hypothetical protein
MNNNKLYALLAALLMAATNASLGLGIINLI